MRGNFRWERDTENYRRYCSETKDPATGKFRVVYFPKVGLGDLPKIIPDLIVSDSDNGIQCCFRDNDWDGNCSIHSAPGVLREQAPAHIRQLEYYKTIGDLETRIHRFDPVRAVDWIPYGTETGCFSSRHLKPQFASYEGHNELEARVTKLEQRQGILFRAVEKLIKMFVPRKKRPPLQQGEYDAVVRSTKFIGPKVIEVDLEIIGPKA